MCNQTMEAGGIEPPSRDGVQAVSTCVVGRLSSGSRAPADRLSRILRPTVSRGRPVRRRAAASPLIGALRVSGRHPVGGLPTSRQPWRSCNRHVRFIARCFTRPPDNLGTRPSLQLARSNPIRPRTSTHAAAVARGTRHASRTPPRRVTTYSMALLREGPISGSPQGTRTIRLTCGATDGGDEAQA